MELSYDPAIPLLGTHTKENRIERDMCTPMFITALFIIARTWKQPRCPSADEWIYTQWNITQPLYSFQNTFESVLMRWMKLEPIIQSEVSQKEKEQYSMLMNIYGIQKDGNDNPVCETARDTDLQNSLLDSVGEGEGGMIWKNGIETCKLSYVKWIASPGLMHDTGCLGLVHLDDSIDFLCTFLSLFPEVHWSTFSAASMTTGK